MRAAWQRTRDTGIPFDVQWGDIDYMDRSEESVNQSLRPPSSVGANTGFNKGDAEKTFWSAAREDAKNRTKHDF